MTLLLDTHTFLWFCQGDTALSPAAKALIEDPNNHKLLSVASCWEIAIKTGLKKLTLGELHPRRPCPYGFELLRITLEHATSVESLPPHHKDPFDRLLVAQARVEGIPLVSADVLSTHAPSPGFGEPAALEIYRGSNRGHRIAVGFNPFLAGPPSRLFRP